MAGNRKYALGRQLLLVPTDGAHSPILDGDPVVVGQMPGVALGTPDANSAIAIDFAGVYSLPVTGANEAGNAAIAVGDILYYDLEAHAVNADSVDGVRFGYALGTVGSGATATIAVKLGY